MLTLAFPIISVWMTEDERRIWKVGKGEASNAKHDVNGALLNRIGLYVFHNLWRLGWPAGIDKVRDGAGDFTRIWTRKGIGQGKQVRDVPTPFEESAVRGKETNILHVILYSVALLVDECNPKSCTAQYMSINTLMSEQWDQREIDGMKRWVLQYMYADCFGRPPKGISGRLLLSEIEWYYFLNGHGCLLHRLHNYFKDKGSCDSRL